MLEFWMVYSIFEIVCLVFRKVCCIDLSKMVNKIGNKSSKAGETIGEEK